MVFPTAFILLIQALDFGGCNLSKEEELLLVSFAKDVASLWNIRNVFFHHPSASDDFVEQMLSFGNGTRARTYDPGIAKVNSFWGQGTALFAMDELPQCKKSFSYAIICQILSNFTAEFETLASRKINIFRLDNCWPKFLPVSSLRLDSRVFRNQN